MKTTVYDHSFNANEWFVMIVFVIGYLLVFLSPKRFTIKETIFFILYGVFTGKFFDHTISIAPFDYYDVNDSSAFQIMDFISYLMYGPFAYFFVYFIDKFRFNRWIIIIYIFTWSVAAIGIEHIGDLVGIYHYKNGYHLFFGFPIYLFLQAILVWFYYHFQKKQNTTLSS